MADFLEDAAAWMHGEHKAHVSRTVTIRRGTASAAVLATIGRTTQAEFYGDVVQRYEMRVFLVDVSDYDFGSGPVEPDDGDTFEDAGATYAIFSDGAAAWRHSDPFKQRYRINTKRIS